MFPLSKHLAVFAILTFVAVQGRDDHHIHELMASMTISDKIAQMSQIDIPQLCEDDPNEEGKVRLSLDKVQTVIGEHGVGSVLNKFLGKKPFTPQEYREAAMLLQEVAKNYSRPPVIWGLDSVHGAAFLKGAVITPQPLNLAATFNLSSLYYAGALASRDTRALGIQWLFAPILGLALHPRWSRVYETFGECPLVVSKMGANFIRGIQDVTQDGGIPSKAAACAKHFVGYSAPMNGHDRSPSWIPTRHLYQYFLPPWKTAIKDEGVLTVMESYTETDGVPNVANPNSLRYLLREQLSFEGLLVTDYEEILNLKNWHRISATEEQAVVHSLREGSVDMSMIPLNETGFLNSVRAGLEAGTLVEERINQSVERVLRLKNVLKMFHEDIVADDVNLKKIGQKKDIKMALEMATQSIVLVKNQNETLPLKAAENILVTGPTANSIVSQCGGWTGEWQGVPDSEAYFTYGSTVLEAIKNVSNESTVKYACGVDILGNECEDSLDDNVGDSSGNGVLNRFEDWAGLGSEKPSNSIERAAALAASVDVVVICVGEEAYAEKPGDIRSLELSIGQYELVSFVKENTNAKVVLVFFGGRPRLLRQVEELADAVLLAFLPGPSGGEAVANILSGAANPSGKLPITYPMWEDGGGSPYFHAVSDKCTKPELGQPLPHYEYEPCEVQWPFGFGLSYTSFHYSEMSLSTKRVQYSPSGQSESLKSDDEPFVVSINVKNRGSVAGYETVFFFTFDEYRSTTPEYKRLRSFEKIFLEPGDEKTVSAKIPVEDFKFVGPHDDSHLILEGLEFRVGIGADTDCREHRKEDGKDSALCSDLITIDAGDDYIAACDTACDLWAASGCAEHLGLSPKKCWSLCTSVSKNADVVSHLGEGEDGW